MEVKDEMIKEFKHARRKGKSLKECQKGIEALFLEKNENLAELVGILLGDGHITLDYEKSSYKVEIALNSDEKLYVDHVYNFLVNKFNVKPRVYQRSTEKTIVIDIGQKPIVEALISGGLMSGNKIKNQVHVPRWICKSARWILSHENIWNMNYRPLVIRCLKGLMDTDGSIYVTHNARTNYTYIGIKFTNGSRPLVEDFKNMCESIDIETSNIYEYVGTTKQGKEYRGYSTSTGSKAKVSKFLEIVMPMKWEVKKPEIMGKLRNHGLTLENMFSYQRQHRNTPFNDF